MCSASAEPTLSFFPAAVVFDMDGLLLDSERLAMQSFCDACESQGVTPDLDIYRRCIGTTHQQTREILIQNHGPDFPYEAVAREWSQGYENHVLHQPVPVYGS